MTILRALRRYKKAETELKDAEEELRKSIHPYFIEAMDDVDKIQRIIGILPRSYRGVRLMYHRIIQIGDSDDDT